ncbi:MAG: hypothetical protein COB85_00965 [Bacteroidetes bacterium]|nr:MAG: hypothetical protein COB85_00965 [Bacteroidota bacterium]
MKTKFLVLFIVVFCSLSDTLAQNNYTNGNKEYVKMQGTWFEADSFGNPSFEVERVFTVKFLKGVTNQQKDSLYTVTNVRVLRTNSLGFVDIEIQASDDVVQVIQEYINCGFCKVAELNIFGSYTFNPNDAEFPFQSHHPLISTPLAWDIDKGSPNVIIAILDNGVDWDHEDLGLGADVYQNIWLNNLENDWLDPNDPISGDNLDNDGNGFIDDFKGWNFFDDDNNTNNIPPNSTPFFHGTHVAGIAGAKMNNSTIGVAGVAGGFGAPGARLMIVKMGSTPTSSILDDAILYAAQNGAHIISLSLCMGQLPITSTDEAIKEAYLEYGVLIVCSSGNTIMCGSPNVSYPASNPHVVAVGGTDATDQLWSDSQFGPAQEIAAPAVNILSTTPDISPSQNHLPFYNFLDGTSMASPQVSGVAALMLSVNSCLTNGDIRLILHETVDNVGGYNYNWNADLPGHSQELGYGRLNAFNAVQAAVSFPPSADLLLQNTISPFSRAYTTGGKIEAGQDVDNSQPFGPFIVSSRTYVTMRAGNEIILSDGFETETNSEFYAFIFDPITCAPLCKTSNSGNSNMDDGYVSIDTETKDIEMEEDINTEEIKEASIYFSSHNYPNPFTDHTHIDYYVKENVPVNISVFNVYGQKVATLVNNCSHPTTESTATLDARNMSSGIYYCTIQSGGKVIETFKMIKVDGNKSH